MIDDDFIHDFIGLARKTVKQKKESIKERTKTYIALDTSTGFIKIGKSVDPFNRLKSLRTGNPSIVLLAQCNGNHELTIHRSFTKHKVNGEWYDVPEYLIKKLMNKYDFTKTRHYKKFVK